MISNYIRRLKKEGRVIKMREITISGSDYFLDTVIGYEGEHKATRLNIKLPPEMISDDIDYYTVEFEVAGGKIIATEGIQQIGGYLSVSPWQQIMVFGNLCFQVTAWSMIEGEASRIDRKSVV